MRILAVSPSSSSARLGLGRAFCLIVSHLSKKNEVLPITRSIYIKEKFPNSIKTLGYISEFLTFLKILRRDDIVLSFVGWAIPTIYLSRKIKGTENPIILSAHAPVDEKKYIGNILKRVEYRLPDRVVAVSRFMAEKLRDVFGISVDVIYNFIDIDIIDKIPGIRLDDRKIVIGYFGNPIPRKHPEIFFEVVEKSKRNFKFIFVGGGVEIFGSVGKNRYNFDGKDVEFFGFVSWEKCISLMKACDILICPYENEPFGYTVLEGMACSKVVITTKYGGMAECIDDGVDGFLCEINSDEFLEKIEMVSVSREEIMRIGRRAREKVEENFSPSKIMSDWEKLLFGL